MRTLCGGGNVGLLHDVDYDRYPKEHCKKCVEILKQEDVPEEMIHSTSGQVGPEAVSL